jgi:hypothetical protein
MSAILSKPMALESTEAVRFDRFFSASDAKTITSTLEPRENVQPGREGELCKTNLFFGFFFDGTKNNYVKAGVANDYSNVARLYDCYPGISVPGVLPKETDWTYRADQFSHFFRVYVPGVASPFPQINDSGDGTAGAAGGGYGEHRIIWALLQAMNNLHRYFMQAPLVNPQEAMDLVRWVTLDKHGRALLEGRPIPSGGLIDNVQSGAEPMRNLLMRLHAAVKLHWPDKETGRPAKINPGQVQKIFISTFGFSRGATEARVFTNWLQTLCRVDARLRGDRHGMSLGGFPVQFDFLGLFDTVASIGLANSTRKFHGHAAWADAEDSLRIPEGLNCLHLVAAHELRRSFPVDSISINGTLPAGCQEIVVPGVHSDVGCGYSPREQGRGTDANGDDMLSRIPLLMMYKAARLNGVPLKLELAGEKVQRRFSLSPKTIEAFNAYLATCKVTSGAIHLIMREQARKQMEWRLFRRVSGASPIQRSTVFLRTSSFHQNDLYSAALEFEEEVARFEEWLRQRGGSFVARSQSPGFHDSRDAEWEEIATWWRKRETPSPEVLRFFDEYVHDSRASFKCFGDVDNEAEMHKLLRKWVQLRSDQSSLGRPYYASRGALLAEGEARAADEYAKTGKIPSMVNGGREAMAVLEAGYLRYRKIYGGADEWLLS